MAVLFSGGLDCTVLAALTDAHVPYTEPIDLINVAFENPRVLHYKSKQPPPALDDSIFGYAALAANATYMVPDRITAYQSYRELRKLKPQRTWNFVHVDVPYADTIKHKSDILSIMAPSDTVLDYVGGLSCVFW